MRRVKRDRSTDPAAPGRQASPAASRNRLAALMALATTVLLSLVLLLAGSKAFLMPGPLQSKHGSIEKCSNCHTQSGVGKLSWLHGLVAGDPLVERRPYGDPAPDLRILPEDFGPGAEAA